MPVSVSVPVLVLELTVAAKSDLLLESELRMLELIAAPSKKNRLGNYFMDSKKHFFKALYLINCNVSTLSVSLKYVRTNQSADKTTD